MSEQSILPDTLAGLAKLAYKDFESIADDPRYTRDLAEWHYPIPEDRTCLACMAGAVMAKTLGVSPRDLKLPYHYPPREEAKLHAISELAHGNVRAAQGLLHEHDLSLPEEAFVDPWLFDDDPEAYMEEYKSLIAYLEEEGL